MMFNATFNNISAISWRKPEYPEKPGETYILINNTQQTDVGFYVRGTAHVGV
jgi:hypothetical protein